MSTPPDDLCICALTSRAYPEFTDQQVIDICADHWESVKKQCPGPHLVPAEEDGFDW